VTVGVGRLPVTRAAEDWAETHIEEATAAQETYDAQVNAQERHS
jgi:hypothetical protein